MDSKLELKSGYMSVHHKGLLGGNIWSNKWCILMAGSSSSPACLYKCDSKGETKISKILDLRKLSKVEKHKGSNITFEVVIKSDGHFFKCKDEMDQTSWIQAFEQILQSRDRCSQASTVSGDLIVEENLLYQSVDDSLMFKVEVVENDDSIRIGLTPDRDYFLVVCLTYIVLQDSTENVLIQWPYQKIKSFGRLPDMFIINTGRNTSTGKGSFSFKTTEGDLIYESISKKTKTQRTYNSNDSLNTTHSLPQLAKSEQSRSPNPSYLSKSASLEVRKVPPESKEEKSNLSKSAHVETSRSVHVSDDSLKQNIEENLKQVLVKQHSSGEEPTKQVFRGSTESQVCTKSLKKEKEKEKKQREKKQKEEQKEKEKRAKEEAKKQEKEKKTKGKDMKKNQERNSQQSHLYDDPTNTYEEVDDVRPSSINSTGAYALPQDNLPTSKRAAENHYSEPDNLQDNLQGSRKSTEKPNMYSTAEQERSEAWRQYGRDTDNLHEEDYENIRIAATNPNTIEGDYDMPEELLSNIPIPPDTEDETYDHISSFNFKPSHHSRRSRPESEVSENIYGDNSGTNVDITQTESSSGYEDASIVIVKSLNK